MEDEAAWLRHRDGIVASLAPEAGLEEFLAHRLASLLWRMNRITRYEVAVTMLHIDDTATDLTIAQSYRAGTLSKGQFIEPEPETIEEHQQIRILPSDQHIERITKLERHFHRQALQTLHEIEALQARRRGQPTYLGRVDFSGPPAA